MNSAVGRAFGAGCLVEGQQGRVPPEAVRPQECRSAGILQERVHASGEPAGKMRVEDVAPGPARWAEERGPEGKGSFSLLHGRAEGKAHFVEEALRFLLSVKRVQNEGAGELLQIGREIFPAPPRFPERRSVVGGSPLPVKNDRG